MPGPSGSFSESGLCTCLVEHYLHVTWQPAISFLLNQSKFLLPDPRALGQVHLLAFIWPMAIRLLVLKCRQIAESSCKKTPNLNQM